MALSRQEKIMDLSIFLFIFFLNMRSVTAVSKRLGSSGQVTF